MINKINRRHLLLYAFSFAMVATLAFLMAHGINASKAYTSGFKAGNIISDATMRDYNSLSESDIQSFLKSKNSCNDRDLSKTGNNVSYMSQGSPYSWHIDNGHYVCMADENFNGESAAHIIYTVAQQYHINPKVLIVLLQKEQALVTDTFPNSIQYRSATGYGCPDTAPCDSQYYGIRNQLSKAAELFDSVLQGGWTNYPLGWNYIQYNPDSSCGGSNVYIENLATSALYRYTPYQPNQGALDSGYGTSYCGAYGNRNFYSYYTDWFGSTQQTFKASDLGNIYLPDGNYQIKSISGLSLDVHKNQSENGTNIQLWVSNGGDAQKFYISRGGDGFYKIKHSSSGKYLDVNGASPIAGANIQVWDGNESCAQKWAISLKNGHYTFRNACSGNALDITGGNINTSGVNIESWIYHADASQQWDLVSLSAGVLPKDGVYSLISQRGKALDIQGGHTSNGANIEIWDKNDSNAQGFSFERTADGLYYIKHAYSDKVIDVTGANPNSDVNVEIWSKNNTCAQKWAVIMKDGHYSFVNICGGNALDIYGGDTSRSGNNIKVWSRNNSDAQLWDIAPHKQAFLKQGTYNIVTTVGGKYLDIVNGSKDNGANVNIWQKNNNPNQDFIFEDAYSGYLRIKNPNANKSLDVNGASSAPGANVQVWLDNGTCAQQWFIVLQNGHTNTSYHIKNACSGNSLDAYGAKTSVNGTNVDSFSSNLSDAQRWNIIKK